MVRICNTGPWHWGTWAMAQRVCVVLSAGEREQLTAIATDRNRPQKHIERAQIVLASADRHPAQQVAQSTGVSRPTVWRWQQRFAESGIDGLVRDRTRKPGKAPIAAETAARVVAMTCTEPPHEAPGHRRRSPAPGSHRTWRADFPHQRSSAVASQHCKRLQLPVGEAQFRCQQRCPFFDLVEGVPGEAAAGPAAAAQHPAPVTLHDPIYFDETPEISGDAVISIVAA